MKDPDKKMQGINTTFATCPYCGTLGGCEHLQTVMQIPQFREGTFGLGLGDFDLFVREIFYQAVRKGRFGRWSWRDRDIDRLWRRSMEYPRREPAGPEEVRVDTGILQEILAEICRDLRGEMQTSIQEWFPGLYTFYLSFQWPLGTGRTTRELEDALCRALEAKAARGMVRTIKKALEAYARAVNTGNTTELDEIIRYPSGVTAASVQETAWTGRLFSAASPPSMGKTGASPDLPSGGSWGALTMASQKDAASFCPGRMGNLWALSPPGWGMHR